MTLAISFLRAFFHTLAGEGPCCRFDPCCSVYARTALRDHGTWRGAVLSVGRLLRCRPGGSYGFDPVPSARGDVHGR